MSRDKVLHKKLSKIYKRELLAKYFLQGRRFLNNILASYEQKKKFYAMRLVKQPISLLPLIDTDGHLGKEPMSPLFKNPA